MPPHAVRPIAPVRRPQAAWLVLALLAVATASGPGSGAELTVTAFGRQHLDLASGRTVLVDGGEVVDRGSGVWLAAAWLSYVDGVDLVARDARIEGDLGRVSAPEVAIDLVAGRLWATGGVTWVRDGLEVRGDELRFDVAAGIAGLIGDVVAVAPAAAAAEAWVEVANGRLLLLGPYRFVDGPVVLSGEEGSALQLDVIVAASGHGYDARTDVEPDWREAVERLRRDAWARSEE